MKRTLEFTGDRFKASIDAIPCEGSPYVILTLDHGLAMSFKFRLDVPLARTLCQDILAACDIAEQDAIQLANKEPGNADDQS